MPNLNSLDACNPALNATVSASAGSGKTWLLITRIVRLLIDGAEAGNIIALTFTRKAAGEMQIRLNERLFEMATTDDKSLEKLLELIGCNTDEETKKAASGLYEKLMQTLYPIRIQTFHSFCQDILSRFPLEADIPPGFELIEDSSLLERQAWQALFDEARTAENNTKHNKRLNDELDTIMQFCNGPDNTLSSLRNFLAHRSDWWAYSAFKKEPADFACSELAKTLEADAHQDPLNTFFDKTTIQKLTVFSSLLREINNKTSDKHAASIDQALNSQADENTRFTLIKTAFIKKDGEVLVQGRKHTAALDKKLGSENAERFIELHHDIANTIQQVNEQLKRILSLKINKAWYYTGHRYVELYQQLKREMRLLDFTDLEWKCYQLLQHADNAQWVQYKIDQRIDHILIDEFQDTNPTQWHLLSPILEEIAASPVTGQVANQAAEPSASPGQRTRSVFLVGDEKQSIYSFRRANPALQAQASEWLATNLNAQATPLDFSRRSSNAIIHCVNQVFEQDKVKAVMTGYTTHGTHLKTLPGQVTLCDLFTDDAEDNNSNIENDTPIFRNPLQQPRENPVKTLRHKEAEYIAKQILQLKNSDALITDTDSVRSVDFGDIMILMRNRTHIAIYEEALKQSGIPFIGSKKGGLLENIEIRDLNCLLNCLITPYNNLGLAQVLKSPIFNASDDDLILLAQYKPSTQKNALHWYQRLLQLAEETVLSNALQRAAILLPRWQQLAEHLPVHDCLDKIFSEGNIINRYVAANRDENKQKVASNCQRFLELSLETDSGRYPSITRFLQRLSHIQNYSQSPPEEPLSQSTESRVRLMTIHASKGLESPVVFLADCNSTASNKNAYATLVRWPADKSQPVNFQLQLNKDNTDQVTEKLQQEKLGEQSREELNLLYVALTRAREQLYISGITNSRNQNNSWYQIISSGLQDITQTETTVDDISCKVYKHLHYEPSVLTTTASKSNPQQTFEIDKRLFKPIDQQQPATFMIAPSLSTGKNITADSSTNVILHDAGDVTGNTAKSRGIVIHRAIELLCKENTYPATAQIRQDVLHQLKSEISPSYPVDSEQIASCTEEAVKVFNHPGFEDIFNPAEDSQVYNEMPLMYNQAQQSVYGIVDRVIKTDSAITIIDYKSHQLNPSESAENIAQQFSAQLDYYRKGLNKLWPDKSVQAGILFTHHNEIIWLK